MLIKNKWANGLETLSLTTTVCCDKRRSHRVSLLAFTTAQTVVRRESRVQPIIRVGFNSDYSITPLPYLPLCTAPSKCVGAAPHLTWGHTTYSRVIKEERQDQHSQRWHWIKYGWPNEFISIIYFGSHHNYKIDIQSQPMWTGNCKVIFGTNGSIYIVQPHLFLKIKIGADLYAGHLFVATKLLAPNSFIFNKSMNCFSLCAYNCLLF